MNNLFRFLTISAILLFSLQSYSQTRVLTQTFNSATFPPTGWVRINAGSGATWTRTTTGTYEGAGGLIYKFNVSNPANAWMITPNIATTAGNSYYVVFYQKVESSLYPENLKITVGQGQTVANQTTTVSDYPNLVNTAYSRIQTASYVAPTTGNYNFGFNCYSIANEYNLYVDSINVYEVPASPMNYISSITTQNNTSFTPVGGTNQEIIGIQIVTGGSLTPFNLTSMSLNTTGSTNPSVDLSSAKVFYSGTVNSFTTTTQFGSTISGPNGSFTVSGTQQLQAGTNYFWLAYDISGSAVQNNVVDAQCTQLVMSGTGGTRIPTVQSPAGNRIIKTPLTGDIEVGLSAFNRISGKSVYTEKRTRLVSKLMPYYISKDNGVKKVNADNSIGFKPEYIGYRTEVVTEEYYILMENGRAYTGPNYIVNRGNGSDQVLAAYTTITAALADLNAIGVSGAVRFLLSDAAYPSETYPLQVNINVYGMSAINTLTIKPESGVTTTISGSVSNNAIFRIQNSNVFIDGSNTNGGTTWDLTIQNTSATTPTAVAVISTGTNIINNVSVKNCIIINTNSASAVVVSDAGTIGNPGYFSNITIQNNNIKNAYIGVFVNGGTSPQNGSNVSLIDNVLNSTGANAITGVGLYMQGVNNGTVGNNEVANIINNTASTGLRTGLWLATGSSNITVERNKFHDLQYSGTSGYSADGIMVSSTLTSCGISIKNNMLYNITSDGDSYSLYGGTYSPVGIYAFGSPAQTGLSIYNNSIYLSGSTINFAGAYSIGICLDGGSTADVRNNLIVNNLGLLGATGAGAMCLAIQNTAASLSQCNYNCYFANPVSGVKGLVKIGSAGTDQTTMTTVRTATGKDQLSFNRQPAFVSGTDLHISASDLSVSGRGTYISSVTNDYDGDTRQTSVSATNRPVDVGADQYSPSLFTGNTTTPAGSIYQDGGLNSVEIVSGTFSGTIKQFPGVRSPHNTFNKPVIDPNGNKNNNRNNQNIKPNIEKNKDGRSGGAGMLIPVNEPWIYWEFTSFTPITGPITLRFYYNPEMLATITETNLRFSYWNGSAWDNNFGPQSVNTSLHYIQVQFPTGVAWPSPSHFAIADNNSPLPVQLCSFDANALQRQINLSWKTCSEVNNKGFEVERRNQTAAGTNTYTSWTQVSFVEGHGTTNDPQIYVYSDQKLATGKFQYRLKQVDFNGNSEYFDLHSPDVIEIGKPSNADVSQNYPNPSNPKSKIDYQIPFDGKVSIKVYDIIGREVAAIVNELKTAGFYTAEFDGTNVASGVYFYRILAEGDGQKFVSTKKMILVK